MGKDGSLRSQPPLSAICSSMIESFSVQLTKQSSIQYSKISDIYVTTSYSLSKDIYHVKGHTKVI